MTLLATLGPTAPVSQAYGRVGDPEELPTLVGASDCVTAMETLGRDHPNRAVRVIAGWLSTREAIWWGALCQAQLLEISGRDQGRELLKAVVLWVRQPGEPTRTAVANLACGVKSPSLIHLVSAISLTAESLVPGGSAAPPCPTRLAHRMVALSILAAATEWQSAGAADCLGHFLEIGLDVSECKYAWSAEPMAVHPGLRPRREARPVRRRLGNIWENW